MAVVHDIENKRRLRYPDEKVGKLKPGKVAKLFGRKVFVLHEGEIDKFSLLKRGPQVVLPFVSGFVESMVMPSRDWKMVDAGGGSGFVSLFFSRLVGKVYTYEKREAHIKIIKENIRAFGAENIVLRNKDVLDSKERSLDFVFLDMKGAEKAVEHFIPRVKPGRYIVVYSPQIEQAIAVVEACGGNCFCETYEPTPRKWKIDPRGYSHPEYSWIGHTGFVTICRKVVK